MAIELRADERQWLRYQSDETIGTIRAAEAWSMRVAGAYLNKMAKTAPTEIAGNLRHIGSILAKISDARMEYLGTPEYETSLESLVGASSFDAIGRFVAGRPVDPAVLLQGTDAILAALTHIETRGQGQTGAGFMHPTRLESILLRGD